MTAVIAAAGSGERLGAGGPKAFVPLAGLPMIEWSVAAFRAAGVTEIVVAGPPGGVLSDPAVRIVDGGATRSASVSNALAAVETELVAIHDAARPLVTPALIEGVIAALKGNPGAAGAIAATLIVDTIKQVAPLEAQSTDRVLSYGPSGVIKSALVEETLDRERLWAAQTPQVFRAEALREALGAHPDSGSATDEAMVVEAAGGRVLIHPAPAENIKVTTPLDLRLAELLLAERSAQ